MTPKVTLIPGDGITRELIPPVLSILQAAGAQVEFEEMPAGHDAWEKTGEVLPKETLESIKRNKVALRGKLVTPADNEYGTPAATLRKQLDLYAAVRPIRNIRGVPARHQNVDIVLIRESTEDIYAGLEHMVRPDLVAAMKVVTSRGCERVSRYAFEYARKNGRKKVTLIHKANIMKKTDGVFIAAAEKVAAEYPDIAFDKLIVDNACMQLMLRPHRYDVVLAGNLYGDIFSDLGAGIVGGITGTQGALYNDDIAVFEAIHGDAPQLVGKGVANPIPMLLPACAMLEHLGQAEIAARITRAVSDTLEAGVKTRDLGGDATTQQVVDGIISRL